MDTARWSSTTEECNISCVNTCTSCSYQSGWVIPFDMRQTWKRQTYISTMNNMMRKAKATVCMSSNCGFHLTWLWAHTAQYNLVENIILCQWYTVTWLLHADVVRAFVRGKTNGASNIKFTQTIYKHHQKKATTNWKLNIYLKPLWKKTQARSLPNTEPK